MERRTLVDFQFGSDLAGMVHGRYGTQVRPGGWATVKWWMGAQGGHTNMISTRIHIALGLAVVIAFASFSVAAPSGAPAEGRIIARELQSEKFAHNKVGVSPVRKMIVYLPAGYDESSNRYPVIYFLPDPFENYRADFDQRDAKGLFDRAIASSIINKFILVSVDMTTPIGCSWYVNSPVTGNWDDFMVEDLVPYMDANFRTLPQRGSRGIAGDHMGGYGALRLAMRHADVFGSVYALHPVGTGSGVLIMHSRPNWDLMANAKSLDDIKGDVFSRIFTSIFQAHLPDPDLPPLFVDLPARKVNDHLVIDSKLTDRLRNNFFIESMIPQYADNLKSLRGLKFDWGRSDPNQDHVYANQALTHKLNEFGIAHEADEYNGGWGDVTWGEQGRVYTEVLPFFQRCLVFERNKESSSN
jgi:hypothetical protein